MDHILPTYNCTEYTLAFQREEERVHNEKILKQITIKSKLPILCLQLPACCYSAALLGRYASTAISASLGLQHNPGFPSTPSCDGLSRPPHTDTLHTCPTSADPLAAEGDYVLLALMPEPSGWSSRKALLLAGAGIWHSCSTFTSAFHLHCLFNSWKGSWVECCPEVTTPGTPFSNKFFFKLSLSLSTRLSSIITPFSLQTCNCISLCPACLFLYIIDPHKSSH